MKARWKGICLVCKRPIEPGDYIVSEPLIGAAHEACDKAGAIREERAEEDLLPSERRNRRREW